MRVRCQVKAVMQKLVDTGALARLEPGALVTLAEALHRVDNTAGAEAEAGAEAGAESGAEVGVGETISAAERLQYFQQVGH